MRIGIIGKGVKSDLDFESWLNGLESRSDLKIIVAPNSAMADDEIYLIEDPVAWGEDKRVPKKNRAERRREEREKRRRKK